MPMISGIADAPSVVTMTGAMPVTRIVPARPTTNAPHQLVSRANPPPAYSSSSVFGPRDSVLIAAVVSSAVGPCEGDIPVSVAGGQATRGPLRWLVTQSVQVAHSAL